MNCSNPGPFTYVRMVPEQAPCASTGPSPRSQLDCYGSTWVCRAVLVMQLSRVGICWRALRLTLTVQVQGPVWKQDKPPRDACRRPRFEQRMLSCRVALEGRPRSARTSGRRMQAPPHLLARPRAPAVSCTPHCQACMAKQSQPQCSSLLDADKCNVSSALHAARRDTCGLIRCGYCASMRYCEKPSVPLDELKACLVLCGQHFAARQRAHAVPCRNHKLT